MSLSGISGWSRLEPKRRTSQGSAQQPPIAVQAVVPSGVSSRVISTWLRAGLKDLPVRPGPLSVALVSSEQIRRINRIWRKKDQPTNVLSFSFRSPRQYLPDQTWGEILVCPAMIRREARIQGIPYRQHLRRLLLHGLIHVAGFDHRTSRQRKTWKKLALQLSAI